MQLATKYQNTNVIKERGIPKPIIILHNLGFNPWEAAIMLDEIMGAIAASITET